MWTMPLPSSSETSSHGIDAMVDLSARAEVVERPAIPEPDEVGALHGSDERLVGVARGRDPLSVLAEPVVGVGLDGRRDVRRERPRRRRPDDERLAGLVEEREADEQGRVDPILVHAALRELVLRDRRAAARAPLRRTVPLVQEAALEHELEEPPDVLDVRVGEREVVVPPVHPLAEPLRAVRELRRRPDHLVAAPARELGEPVLLDLPLRVEPELALDPDLDPETLAVEAVLVALVEALQRLVALEDVLECSPPGGMDGERLVRRHGAVDEAEARAGGVLGTQAVEGRLALPRLEDLELEGVMVRLVRQRCEDRRHEESV